jgi:cytochrome c biogenesis protein CcdA
VDAGKKLRRSILDASETIQENIPEEVKTTFRKGPAGIQYVSFAVGIAIVIVQVLQLIQITHIFEEPDQYVLHVYQLCGGLLIAVLEMDPDWLANVVQYRRLVNDQAYFLTHLAGRGLCYIFIGSVAIVQKNFQEQITGWLVVLVGILYMGFHYLLTPERKRQAEQYMRSGSGGEGIRPLLEA